MKVLTKAYSGLPRHIQYPLTYSKPYHIPSRGMFRTGGIFKTL